MKSGQHIKMKCRFSATISNLKKVAYFDISRPVKVGKFAKRMRCMSLAVLFLVKARSFARPAFSNFSNSFFVGAFCRRLSKWTNVLEKARRLYAGLSLTFVYSSLSLPHRCQVFWLVWSEKMLWPEGARVRPEGPNL